MDRTSVLIWLLSILVMGLWWSLVNADKCANLKHHCSAFFNNSRNLEWLSEMTSHLAFYGSAVGGFVGFENGSTATYFFVAYWFFSVLLLSYFFVARAGFMEAQAREADEVLSKENENV